MKSFTLTASIALSLILAVGCKNQSSELQQSNTNVQDVVVAQGGAEATDNTNTNSNQGAPDSDATKESENVGEKVEPQNAQNPTENSDSELVQNKAQDLPSEYVELAEWCRPGMTKQISAQEWAKANNAFGFKYLAQTKGNTVFSPYSIERALGMTLDGACVSTATEMLSALELPNAMQLSLSGRDVDDAMKSVNDGTMLEIENTLWPDKSMTLPNDYLVRISAGYRNKLIQLDYAANPEMARITINDDVARSTHDRIKDLLPSGSITEQTRLVLTNAVYFKSVWGFPFKEEYTRDDDFYNSNKKIRSKMMHKTDDNKRVCVGKDFAFYDFAFKSSKNDGELKGSYVMRIILPAVDEMHPMKDRMKQLEIVENQLSNDYTANCTLSAFDRVEISMPKFKLAPDTVSLRDMLETMGMKRAFDDNLAQFWAMANLTAAPLDESPYLVISDIFHKAFIEIDEKGGEAAAATAVIMKKAVKKESRPSPPPTIYKFTVDHPFLFMIIEQSTGATIFMGRVTDL